ncbi:hypothetical protein [Luteimonas suaedae]|uniref:hypothetical protein n=1 Tax=Luteimonas suaedae TaxID=2605430 RepID=UPI001CA93DE4|nr:hypothetical protein [Luteimonas suaedae]
MKTCTIQTRENRLASASLVAADWVCLAAAPAFATMALLTAISSGGSHGMTGPTAHGASPLDGMALMYLLMSAFHTAPWLKLVSRRRSGAGGRDPALADRSAIRTVEGGSHDAEPAARFPERRRTEATSTSTHPSPRNNSAQATWNATSGATTR